MVHFYRNKKLTTKFVRHHLLFTRLYGNKQFDIEYAGWKQVLVTFEVVDDKKKTVSKKCCNA